MTFVRQKIGQNSLPKARRFWKTDFMNKSMPAIETTSVTKNFGSVTALSNINLKIEQGQITALLGKNGAGKTTLIDIVLGLQTPTDGQVKLFGYSPREAIRRGLVGVVQQTDVLIMDVTVMKLLKLFASAYPHALNISDVLEQTNLTKLGNRKVGKLSGGERQRVRLALALLPDPFLLILDEPTSGMDVTARREFWELMQEQSIKGRTIVFATHYLAEVESIAQKTVILDRGKVIINDQTDLVRTRIADRNVSAIVPVHEKEKINDFLKTWALPTDNSAASVVTQPSSLIQDQAEQLVSLDWCVPTGILPGDQEQLLKLTVRTSASDKVARNLLSIPGVRDLTITNVSLDEVFEAVTNQ